MDRITVTVSLDALWLLQAHVRHEIARQGEWTWPPASLSLNDAIAAALDFCVTNQQSEAALLLGRGDCLVIDACVPQDAKDVHGRPIGRELLLMSFRVRRELAQPEIPDAAEPAGLPTKREIVERLRPHAEE